MFLNTPSKSKSRTTRRREQVMTAQQTKVSPFNDKTSFNAVYTNNKSSPLLSCPTEIVELIATYLPPCDLKSFRLTNLQLASQSYYTFLAMFKSVVNSDDGFELYQSTARQFLEIAEHPALARQVLSVDIAEDDNEPLKDPNAIKALNLLPSLTSLRIAAYWHYMRYNACFWHLNSHALHLPNLQKLYLVRAQTRAVSLIKFMERHQKTLSSVSFDSVWLRQGNWLEVLKAFAEFDGFEFELHAPRDERFHRNKFDISAQDVDAQHVSTEGQYQNSKYMIKAGTFKEGLGCLIRSYLSKGV